MRIFFDKKTGEIIGTIDGFSDDPVLDKMMIVPGNMKPEDIGKENIHLGHPLELAARMFENPQHPANVLEYRVELDKKGRVIRFIKKER